MTTIFRIIIIVICLILLIGFGVCGAMGLQAGFLSDASSGGSPFIFLGFAGLAISIALAFAIRALVRNLVAKSRADNSSNP